MTRELKRWFFLFAAFALFKVVVTAVNIWTVYEHPSNLGESISASSFYVIAAFALLIRGLLMFYAFKCYSNFGCGLRERGE